MSDVKILYCPNREPTAVALVNKSVDEINAQSDISIRLIYAPSYQDFAERLSRNNGYNFAILKLPVDADEVCEPRKDINPRFSGVLVAESTRHPFNSAVVLGYFDAYIAPIMHSQNLVKLLRQYNFLPQDFEL